jgi:hypothetical protein
MRRELKDMMNAMIAAVRATPGRPLSLVWA